MSDEKDMYQIVEQIVQKDATYKSEAYLFVLAALQHRLKKLGKRRDVTGEELLQGIKALGIEQYGPTTRMVFEHWGVRCTEDFGRIVFNMVDAGLLRKTEEDSIEDFKGVFDFREEFDKNFKFRVDKESL
jgi:uncharacterized repeat protein (TIGR04138 family)